MLIKFVKYTLWKVEWILKHPSISSFFFITILLAKWDEVKSNNKIIRFKNGNKYTTIKQLWVNGNAPQRMSLKSCIYVNIQVWVGRLKPWAATKISITFYNVNQFSNRQIRHYTLTNISTYVTTSDLEQQFKCRC